MSKIGGIIQADISERLSSSFLNYAMYVIQDRALPDAKDGLKPVQRRILYSMHDLGLYHNRPYKKSARIVGDVLGRFHPHGDASVYEAMVNMAQDFSMRYPLVDGQGNFGSIDGDSAAAMRYTEARLSKTGELILKDLDKEVVEFVPNFDESLTEPSVLPTFFPNLLANGTTGIAVSMATSIPPHNAKDLYRALRLIVENELEGKKTGIEDLIDIVQAPDFPTGGVIINPDEVRNAYRTGKGRVRIRGKYEIESVKSKEQIVIKEIPFMVNKAKLVETIDELRKSVPEIKEVRDESDKQIRIVVELKKGANNQRIIRQLLKKTPLESTFSMNMVALFDGKPKQFNLKEALDEFLAHVAKIIINRSLRDLKKAEDRKEIVSGILSVLENLEAVIETIKGAESNQAIIDALMSDFGFTKKQAESIAAMRLSSLSRASRTEYEKELMTLTANIQKWQAILENEKELLSEMIRELDEVAQNFQEDRRTDIEEAKAATEFDERELIKDEALVVILTAQNMIKCVSDGEYKSYNRGAKGVKANLKDGDTIRYVLSVNSKDDLLFFTNKGKCHVLEVYKLPVTKKGQAGKYVQNYLDLEPDEKIVNLVSRSLEDTGRDLLFFTKLGIGKRLKMSELSRTKKSTRVITFRNDDELVQVLLYNTNSDVIVFSKDGQAVRFSPDGKNPIRPMGRDAAGVKVMNLEGDDVVVEAVQVDETKDLLVVTVNGYGKKVSFGEFSVMNRGAKGLRAIPRGNDKIGHIAGALAVGAEDDLLLATKNGQVGRIKLDDMRVMGRSAAGVKLMNLEDGDEIATVSLVSSEQREGEEECTPTT